MNIIDLRSDTVTKPTEEMRKAMYDAEVGDDIYREDPTIIELENYAAELLGKEAALFVPSGVMGNQICLNILTQPGDEIICEKESHIFLYESGSCASLSGLQLNMLEGKDGMFTADQVESVIRPREAYYMPRTKLVEIENTHNNAGGTINPISNIASIQQVADDHGLFMHLDGARIWNASVATGVSLEEYASYFDTVSCCLSKGLGAPIGSIIAGYKDLIDEAYRVRKGWGGGMRQVGILGAAGLYALKNNIDKIADDHSKADELAEALSKNEKIEINLDTVQTNIIKFKVKDMLADEVIVKCKENGILLGAVSKDTLRIVTHMDVSIEQIEEAKKIFEQIFS